jgi:hypothetical protein
VSGGLKWGISVLDWHTHAIDEHGNHPIGVYVARGGHRLMMVTALHESPPSRICLSCARWDDRWPSAPG